ncbi:D-aminoacyl-tRNA deacylase [Candidatus Hydrogenedentota bacterium]
MRVLVQRVARAAVHVDGKTVGGIGEGLLVFVGVVEDDTKSDINYLVDKIAGLRIFEDSEGKMNLSMTDLGLSMLVVSQFTLCADCRKGRRPSFNGAANPARAEEYYEKFIEKARNMGINVEAGTFQAMMDVELVNKGPVTIQLDSKKLY